MDREALLDTLVRRYGSIAQETGMTPTDDVAGFGPVLDRVQGWLDAMPDLEGAWVEPLARYEALDYLADRLSTQINVSLSGGKSYQINQQFTNVRALLADARAAVAWIVAPVSPGGATGDVPAVSAYSVIVPGPTW